MWYRLVGLALAVVLATACASSPRTRSFTDLPKYLKPGRTIKVMETTGPAITGRLVTLSSDSLAVLAKDGNRRHLPQHRVLRIEREHRNAFRGALIGFGAGLGLGLVTGRSGTASENPLVDTQVAAGNVIAGAVLGTVVGTIVGAVVKVNRTVYLSVPPSPPSAPHPADWPR